MLFLEILYSSSSPPRLYSIINIKKNKGYRLYIKFKHNINKNHYAVNFALPFVLLALRTALPAEVFILFLKPCSFFYCLFLGWYVIFIVEHLLYHKIHNPEKDFNTHFRYCQSLSNWLLNLFCWQYKYLR